MSTADSLILGDVVELLAGGAVSAHPLCPGATMVLAPGFTRGAGVPETAVVQSLLLDGERPTGRRTANRTITLPIKISAPTRAILNGARELLLDIVDQQRFRLQWTPDPQGGTALPLIFHCYRATEAVPQYDQDMEDQLVAYVTLTFPAHPFGRSDTLTTLAFPAPALSWSSPPVPVRVDDYSTVSSSTNPADWSQSAQAIDDSFSARWSEAGSSTNPVYTRTLGASVAITGLDRLVLNFGLGTATYNDWHGGRVTFAITLTDNAAHTLSFGGNVDVAASNDINFPLWQPVTFQIPASGVFSFANVTAYSIKVWRRVTWFGTQALDADAYLNGLTATASAAAPIPAVRGTVYRIGAPGGTARTLMQAQFQPAAPPSGTTTDTVFSTPGPFSFVPGLGQTSAKVRGIGGSGIGGKRTTTGTAGGAGGGAGVGHDTYPLTPGQAITGVIGAAGTNGGFPTLAATYTAFQDSSNTASLVTASFVPSANDVLVIKAIVADGFSTFGSPSGGGLTWTSQVNIGPTGTSRVRLWTATVGGSPTAMTVTVPFSGYALPHGMVVERWSSAKVAGSPALLSASGSGSAPSGTCTTVAAQSVVSWVNSDHTAGTGARTYRSSATEEQYHNVTVPFAGYTGYWAWQTAAAAGAQTCGLTAPASQTWELAGIEIQAFSTGGLTDGGDTLIDGVVFRAAGGKSVPDNTTTGGLGGTVAASTAPGGGTVVRGGNGANGSTTGGGGGSGAGTAPAAGGDASGATGGTPPTGGGAGGTGAAAGGNNAGGAGSAPGGGGAGAVSTGGTAAGGAGQPGKVIFTTAPAITPIKTLLVHAPGYNAPSTFSPLIPAGAGLDAPDGREYTIPAPVEGLNARFYGTYTIVTFWSNIDTPANSRTHTVTFKQYDYPGGPSTSRSAVRTLTPNTESPAILNGVVIVDTITLPCRDIADDQTAAYTTVGVTSTNASDRCLDVAVIDVTGQLLLWSHATGFPNIWWDPPDGIRDWGRILGSQADRAQAVSVLDSPLMILSGGPLIIDPDGPGWLLAYSPDAGAPALTAGFWAAWRDSRLS